LLKKKSKSRGFIRL